MLSGALSSSTSPNDGIKKALYYFLVFIVAALFYYFFDIILHGGVVTLYGIANGILNYCYHLWFLLDMIVVMLLAPFINRITGKALHYAVALMFIFLILFRSVGLFFPEGSLIQDGGNFLSNLVPSGLLFCGYFLTGKLLYQEREHLCSRKRMPAFIFPVTSALAFYVIYQSNIAQGMLDETFLAANSIFVFLQCVSIFWLLLEVKVSPNFSKIIVPASQRTFGIYIIHVAVLDILTKSGITPAGIIGIAQGSLLLTIVLVPVEIVVIYLASWLSACPLAPIGRLLKKAANKISEKLFPFPEDI